MSRRIRIEIGQVAQAGSAVIVALALVVVSMAPVGAFDDPGFARQWALARIGAEAAWATSTGQGVRVGIVDTGIDLAHEDLTGKVVAHTNCIGASGDPSLCQGPAQDYNGHGTHVAGIVAARAGNTRGVAGVAPDAELVVAKALDANGSGAVEDVVAAIKWVVDHGARVVNLSLGDPNFVLTSLMGTPMAEGIEYAFSHGAVPVLASGNSDVLGLGVGSSEYGDLDAVVVGATGPDDTVASYSSPLGNAKWTLVAPGGAGGGGEEDDILSTYWEDDEVNSYRALAGTSMATPHVTAAIALLLAFDFDAREAIYRVLETADRSVSCDCPGRLDAAAAVELMRRPSGGNTHTGSRR